MAVSTDRPLPRLQNERDVLLWARRLVEDLHSRLNELGFAFNAGGGGGGGSPALNPPPDIANAAVLGVSLLYAREDHTHKGVTLNTVQTITAGKYISAHVAFGNDSGIDKNGSSIIWAQDAVTQTADYTIGESLIPEWNPSGDIAAGKGFLVGSDVWPIFAPSINGTGNAARSLDALIGVSSSLGALANPVTAIVTDAVSFNANGPLHNGASSFSPGTTVTNLIGLNLENHGFSGATNSYGIRVRDQSGATNTWAIKTGTGKVQFGGTFQLDATGPGALVQTTAGGVVTAETLAVARGGTGKSSVTANALLYGAGTSPLTELASATGWLKSSGGAPSWAAITAGDVTAGAALTRTNNAGTALSLTLSGTPASALLAATDIALGAAGVSGGVPYFNTATTLVTSGALTASALVLGGGAGNPPATPVGLGTTTQVLHGNAAGAPTWGAVNLATDVSGTLGIGSGGTGQTTALAAFNALSPLTTRGDLLTRNATDNARVAIAGSSGKFLRSDGTDPSWQAIAESDVTNLVTDLGNKQPLDTDLTEIAAVANVLGDLLYTDATPSWVRLAGNTLAAKRFLTQTGTGAVSAAPTWGTIAWADVDKTGSSLADLATRLHASLTDTGGDDHADHAYLLGRAGGQNFRGGTAAGDFLDLAPHSVAYAVGNAGRVRVRERMLLQDQAITVSGVNSSIQVGGGATYTLDNIASGVTAMRFDPVLNYTVAPLFGIMSQTFLGIATFNWDFTGGAGVPPTFYCANTFTAANTRTVTMLDSTGSFTDTPNYNVAGTGTFGGTVGHIGFYSSLIVNSGTLPLRRGFRVAETGGAGALTTQIGLDIDALTKATTNIGIRSAIVSGANNYCLQNTGGAVSQFLGGIVKAYASTGFVIPTGYFSMYAKRTSLSGTQRITIQGDGRLQVAI